MTKEADHQKRNTICACIDILLHAILDFHDRFIDKSIFSEKILIDIFHEQSAETNPSKMF